MLTMETNYISHVLMLKLKWVSHDRSMSGNLLKGVIIDEIEIKLSAYADDGSLFVTDIHSVQITFFICNQFKEFSWLKLNLEKSEACWIGKAKVREDKPFDCNWINLYNDKIRILGVYNSYDTDLENSYNLIVLNAGKVEISQLQKNTNI